MKLLNNYRSGYFEGLENNLIHKIPLTDFYRKPKITNWNSIT